MEYRIDTLQETKLVGKSLRMSLIQNKTQELWQSFMPSRHKVAKAVGSHLYSLQVLPPNYFAAFSPSTEFNKWAAVEVSAFEDIPEGMETLVVPAGLYAVFLYKGPASAGAQAFQYIFGTWLPQSDYTVDDRPQFELLGEKYKNDSVDSEEEIWIPIKSK